jgi:hypothetical protein
MAGWVLAFMQGVCKLWPATGKNHSMISQLLWVLKQPLTMAPQATSFQQGWGDFIARRFDRAASSIAWMWWIPSIMADRTGTEWNAPAELLWRNHENSHSQMANHLQVRSSE